MQISQSSGNISLLENALKGQCQDLSEDLKVHLFTFISQTDFFKTLRAIHGQL